MFSLARRCLFFLPLLTISALCPAQDDLSAVHRKVDLLQKEIEARAEAEARLRDRVNALESQLAKERSETAERIHVLETRTAPEATELERAIARLETIERSPAAQSALALSGYFDLEFRVDQAVRNPTFDQHRFVLKADAEIAAGISFKSELEIEGGGADVSYLSGQQILLEYAELHFEAAQEFTFKVGALLVPFGRLNALHDSPLQDLTDRPLVDTFIVPTTWQMAGIGAQGAFDLDPVVIDYDVVLTNGLDDDFSATPGGGLRDARSSFRRDSNDDLMITGRLGFTIDTGFLDAFNLGFSFANGEYDDDNRQDITMFGIDGTIRVGPFELLGEYAAANLERGPAQAAAGVPGGMDGWYVQLNYHFFPDTWRGTWRFFTEESTFTLVFRYGTTDTDDSALGIDRAARGDAFRDDLQHATFGVNFRPLEKTVFKIEYQWFFEKDGIDDAANDRLVFSIATYF